MSMKNSVQGYLEQTKHYLIRENEKNKNELFTNYIYILLCKYTHIDVCICVLTIIRSYQFRRNDIEEYIWKSHMNPGRTTK